MRLHHLSLTAFGPFAGTEQVDFDELCDAGLFLLTGPTGAGKTTVLDAVCFALYGSVPGVRGVKTLRSQHAAEGVRPEVVLDFSVRARRFVVRRSPEWTRPKRRGDGLTIENATATLVETTTGEDHLLSSRAQEVGHFIGELVGMQATQFVQVAMLPQGDFQKFLRASSQDRHDVLQHLFRTDRYSRIEDWVHDHSRTLRERSEAGQQQVLRVLETVSDRVGAELPELLRAEALADPEAAERALAWVDQLLGEAVTTRCTARHGHECATQAVTQARARRDAAVQLQGLHQRREQALATLAEAGEDAAAQEQAGRALDADDRASRCLPLLRMLDEARDSTDRHRDTWAGAAQRLAAQDLGEPALPDPVTVPALADLEQRVQSRAARLELLLPREDELHRLEGLTAQLLADLDAATAQHMAVAHRARVLPAALAAAGERCTVLAAAAARTDALDVELQQAACRLDAAREAQECAGSLPALRDRVRDARDRAGDARELVQELTARRLAGMAAELAGALGVGDPCQVCGSTEHPAPAASAQAAVTEAEQAEAAAAYDLATADLNAATGTLLQAEERLEGLRVAAGGLDVAEARARADQLTDRLQEARDAERVHAQAQQVLDELRAEQDSVTGAEHDLALRTAALGQSVESHRDTIHRLRLELGEVSRSEEPLSRQLADLGSLAEAVAQAREALVDHDTALARLGEVHSAADEAAREHGFPDAGSVRPALLDPAERHRLEQLLEARAQARARALGVLEDDAMRGLDDRPPPDLTALAEATTAAEAEQTSAARLLHHSEDLVSALGRLRDRLAEAFLAWDPVRVEHLRADSMSKLVRGMGGDNQLQMRLSAYVLATRLDQVVAAANERLGHMRDHRYLLQRTGRVARKGAQAGLGLEVVDQWTGDVRDPTTLSGGETFVVSLSLALGLADVVTQEAGGTEIETLFVDEGFGTLDADTLDDVMDRLDELRAGGRAVGVVSHVSELRNRIPTQLHVEKRRTGSTVAVRTAVG